MAFVEKIKVKATTYLAAIKARMVRSETYTIILPAFVACLLLLTFLPYLFNNSALQFQIEQRVSAALKANLEIGGKVDVALIPTPSITVHDVILQDYKHGDTNYSFYAKKVTIKLSFLSSLMGEFAVDKIIFSRAILQNYNSDAKPDKMQDELTDILAKKSGSRSLNKKSDGGISGKIFVDLFKINEFNTESFNFTNLPEIFIRKSSLVTYDKFSNKSETLDINARTTFSAKKIIANGSFATQDIINNFTLNAKFHQKIDDDSDKNNSTLELTSSYGNFKISGVFPDENLGFLKSKFKGKIEAEIFDLKNFYRIYVSRDGFIYNKINPSIKSIKLKASIINNEGQVIISNIFVNSNIVNGRGDVTFDLSAALPIIDVKLNLENIDLDAVWLSDKEIAIADAAQNAKTAATKTPDEASTDKPEESDNSNNSNLDSETKKEENALTLNLTKDIRDFDLTAEITVSRVKYLNEEIKNVDLYTTISKQGEILILPLTLEVPGGGLFRMSGVLENYTTPKFIGSLDARGTKLSNILKWLQIESQNLIYDNLKDYNLYADIMLIPNSTILNNIYLNINNGQSELLGEARIHYTTKTSGIISNFHVNNLTMEDYFLTSGQNIYLSPGSLLKKLLWLNNLTSNNDLSLSFDKLIYKDSTFNNQSIKMRFGQGYFEVSELKLNSNDLDLSASLAVDISGTNPKLDLAINAKNFTYQSLKNNSDSDEAKTDDSKPNLVAKKITALDQFYALPSLEGFGGDISFDLKHSSFDDFVADNVKIAGKLKDGIISFTGFSADIYNGNLTYTGVVGIKFDKAVSGNATLTEIALKPLLSDLVGIKNIDATANISASIENLASNKEEFFKNLNSSVQLSAAGVTVDNYGLNDLIKKMFNIKNYAEDLRDPEKILFNPNSKTNFKQATGTIVFEKGRDNLFRFNVETVAANGIVAGKIDLIRNKIDGSANIVFLTGSLSKQVPLNIATNLKGDFGNIRQSSNLDQIKQYLKLPDAPAIAATAADISNVVAAQQALPSGAPTTQQPPQAKATTDNPNPKTISSDSPINVPSSNTLPQVIQDPSNVAPNTNKPQ